MHPASAAASSLLQCARMRRRIDVARRSPRSPARRSRSSRGEIPPSPSPPRSAPRAPSIHLAARSARHAHDSESRTPSLHRGRPRMRKTPVGVQVRQRVAPTDFITRRAGYAGTFNSSYDQRLMSMNIGCDCCHVFSRINAGSREIESGLTSTIDWIVLPE